MRTEPHDIVLIGGMRRRPLILAVVAFLGACAQTPPPAPRLRMPALQLGPGSLGASVSLAQRLSVLRSPMSGRGRVSENSLDTQLEIEPGSLRLAAFALGQRVMLLQWDGHQLQEQRHKLLPAEVDAAHVLRDVQLAYWPADAISAALPPGWALEQAAYRRTLSFDGQVQVQIDYSADAPHWQGQTRLDNLLEGYCLTIESKVLSEP